MGCKRVLLSDDYYPALARANVDAGHRRRSREVRRGRRGHRRRRRCTRSTRSSSAPGSTSPTCRWRDASAARDGRTPRRGLGRQHAGLPGIGGRRLPQPVPAARPEHRARPHLGGLHDRVPARLSARRAAPHRPRGRRHAGADARARRRPTSRRIDRRMAGTVWPPGGCRSWYLDATGRNSALWPGYTWAYWLRTRRFDPAPTAARSGGAVVRPAARTRRAGHRRRARASARTPPGTPPPAARGWRSSAWSPTGWRRWPASSATPVLVRRPTSPTRRRSTRRWPARVEAYGRHRRGGGQRRHRQPRHGRGRRPGGAGPDGRGQPDRRHAHGRRRR